MKSPCAQHGVGEAWLKRCCITPLASTTTGISAPARWMLILPTPVEQQGSTNGQACREERGLWYAIRSCCVNPHFIRKVDLRIRTFHEPGPSLVKTLLSEVKAVQFVLTELFTFLR